MLGSLLARVVEGKEAERDAFVDDLSFGRVPFAREEFFPSPDRDGDDWNPLSCGPSHEDRAKTRIEDLLTISPMGRRVNLFERDHVQTTGEFVHLMNKFSKSFEALAVLKSHPLFVWIIKLMNARALFARAFL